MILGREFVADHRKARADEFQKQGVQFEADFV